MCDVKAEAAKPCPSCGHCPTCGRGPRMAPYPYYWPRPYGPYWSTHSSPNQSINGQATGVINAVR